MVPKAFYSSRALLVLCIVSVVGCDHETVSPNAASAGANVWNPVTPPHSVLLERSSRMSPELRNLAEQTHHRLMAASRQHRRVVRSMMDDMRLNRASFGFRNKPRDADEQCTLVERVIAKHAPQLAAATRLAGGSMQASHVIDMVSQTPVCRSAGRSPRSVDLMELVGTASAAAHEPDPLDEFVDAVLADSASFSGVQSLASVNLGTTEGMSAVYNMIYTAVDASSLGTINGVATQSAQNELWAAYEEALGVDWQLWVIQEPYMILGAGGVLWRWPTASELWGFVGAGCTGSAASAIHSGAVMASVRAGARVGAVVGGVGSGGTATVAGAVIGGAAGGAAAIGASCAVGAAGGAVAMAGWLSTQD